MGKPSPASRLAPRLIPRLRQARDLNCFAPLREFLRSRGFRVLFPQVAPTSGVADRAAQLREQIRRFTDEPVNLVAHSMGGLVSRWYIEKEGGKEQVNRLLLLASPWDGSPKAMDILFDGLDTLFRRLFNLFNIGPRSRAMIRTFPSVYQLLPYQDPFLRGLDNEVVDPFNDAAGWLENAQQRQLLLERSPNRTLRLDLKLTGGLGVVT